MTNLETRPLAGVDRLETGDGATLAWLGQAGFLIAQGGLRIVIDAYLSIFLRRNTAAHVFRTPA